MSWTWCSGTWSCVRRRRRDSGEKCPAPILAPPYPGPAHILAPPPDHAKTDAKSDNRRLLPPEALGGQASVILLISFTGMNWFMELSVSCIHPTIHLLGQGHGGMHRAQSRGTPWTGSYCYFPEHVDFGRHYLIGCSNESMKHRCWLHTDPWTQPISLLSKCVASCFLLMSGWSIIVSIFCESSNLGSVSTVSVNCTDVASGNYKIVREITIMSRILFPY